MKAIKILILVLLFFSCNEESTQDRTETISDLLNNNIWSVEYFNVNGYSYENKRFAFNNDVMQYYLNRIPSAIYSQCYLSVETNETHSLEEKTDNLMVVHINIPEEEARHIFELIDGNIHYTYKEWNNGIYAGQSETTILTLSDLNINVCE